MLLIFFEWSIKNGYSDNLTIDRIDTNGNYSPENCRWITQSQQSKNRRNLIVITIDGESKFITHWCKHYNISYSSYKNRIKNGYSPIEALTTPKQSGTPLINKR